MDLVNIGTVVGTHHLIGTVKVNSIFEDIEVIIGKKVVLEKGDIKKLLTVNKVQKLNDRKLLVDFLEIKNRDEAREINGFQVKIRRDLLPEKNEDEFYIKDLLGINVYENGKLIGSVLDVMETAAHEILIILDEKNNEIMVPLIEEFVKEIDFKNNRLIVKLIEGMR